MEGCSSPRVNYTSSFDLPLRYNKKKLWRRQMSTREKIHIIQAKNPEELEESYNQWTKTHVVKVGVEVVDRQYLQTETGYQVAIFYKEVVL